MEKLLKVRNLSVSYFTYAGEVQSVRNISFDIEKGKTTAIVGESGCGKTVTAKSIMGLIHKPGKIKENSSILFEGEEITKYTRNRLK
jgi:oligopeptide transport system ATP-binding protein